MIEQLVREFEKLKERVRRLEAQESGFVTPDGGFAIRVIAGENLVRGNIVALIQGAGGTDGRVRRAPTSGNEQDMPLGAVFAAANTGEYVWVTVSGIAYALPATTVTAARGYVAFVSSSVAGMLDQSNSGAAAQHWRECGHWLDTGTGAGALTRIVMHFN